MRPCHAQIVLIGTLTISLLAGCAAARRAPGVANLGTTGTTDHGTTTGTAPSASPGGDNAGQAILIGGLGGLGFCRCMRAHGVATFPTRTARA